MPRRGRGNIGQHNQNSRRLRNIAARRTEEERTLERELARNRMAQNRAQQPQEIRELINEQERLRRREVRARKNDERRSQRLTIERQRRQQRNPSVNIERAAFQYDPQIDYSTHRAVSIGEMINMYAHCKALKYTGETPGLCCANGKVKLTPMVPPPEPLHSLISGVGSDSAHFLQNIQKYNNCFQMTSFGATNIVREGNFMPTFKVITDKIPSESIYNTLMALIDITTSMLIDKLFRFSLSDSRPSISSGGLIVTSSKRRLSIFANIFHGEFRCRSRSSLW